MPNELAVIERQLLAHRPMFEDLLRSVGVPAERIIRTVLVSCERSDRLRECTPVSIIQGATSFAVLGLEVDGFTGQGYLIPFRDKGVFKAQPVIGYRGYNTIGARTGLTITGAVVREGDHFDFQKGTGAFVRHKPLLGAGKGRKISAAWAIAEANDRPPAIEVLDIDEILAVRARSPAVKGGFDTPWKDDEIGFPAMAEKTAKRRLSRMLPLSVYQLAARMEEAHDEQGRHAFLHPDKGVVIDGVAQPLQGEAQPANPGGPEPGQLQRPRYVVKGRDGERVVDSIEAWRAMMEEAIRSIRNPDSLARFRGLNEALMDDYNDHHPREVAAVAAAFTDKERNL